MLRWKDFDLQQIAAYLTIIIYKCQGKRGGEAGVPRARRATVRVLCLAPSLSDRICVRYLISAIGEAPLVARHKFHRRR